MRLAPHSVSIYKNLHFLGVGNAFPLLDGSNKTLSSPSLSSELESASISSGISPSESESWWCVMLQTTSACSIANDNSLRIREYFPTRQLDVLATAGAGHTFSENEID